MQDASRKAMQDLPVMLEGHMPVLDGIRGAAIALVVFMHFFEGITPSNFLENVFVRCAGFGVFGLDLFFLLSGFLITGILWDSRGAEGYFRRFMGRRCLRIFPLYYGVLLVTFFILPRIPYFSGTDMDKLLSLEPWTWTYLVNVKVASAGTWIFPYLSHFWSLAVEEHFYLFWPAVVLVLSRGRFLIFCLMLIAFGLLSRVWMRAMNANELAVYVLTFCRFDTLCAGAFLAVLLRDGRNKQDWIPTLRKGTIYGVFCSLALLGISTSLKGNTSAFGYKFWRDIFYWMTFVTGFVGILVARTEGLIHSIFSSRLLMFLGRYSYGLYVFHGVISWHFHKIHAWEMLTTATGNRSVAYFAQGILGILLSTGISVISFHLYEKPFLRLKKYFSGREHTTRPKQVAVLEA
jgi:peptidoglycan/LPS O-acetylase OafA/YrhL